MVGSKIITPYKSKQGCKKVDWVSDIPSKWDEILKVKLSPSKNQNLWWVNLSTFMIRSLSKLQSIWGSLDVIDCKVIYLGSKRICSIWKYFTRIILTDTQKFIVKILSWPQIPLPIYFRSKLLNVVLPSPAPSLPVRLNNPRFYNCDVGLTSTISI